jgi:hypothetical protein
MLTIGIDLASQPKNTALCAIEWTANDARVQDCRLNITDSDIEAAADTADKVGAMCHSGGRKRSLWLSLHTTNARHGPRRQASSFDIDGRTYTSRTPR